MPVYTYRCHQCDGEFDLPNQPFGRDTAECPECDAEAIRQFRPSDVVIRMPKLWMQASRKMMLPDRDRPEFAQKSWSVGGLPDAADRK